MSNFPFLYSTVWKSKIFSLHLYSNQFPFFLKHRPIDWNVCLPCHTKLLLCGLINVFKFFGPSFLLKSAFSLHVCLLIRKKNNLFVFQNGFNIYPSIIKLICSTLEPQFWFPWANLKTSTISSSEKVFFWSFNLTLSWNQPKNA